MASDIPCDSDSLFSRLDHLLKREILRLRARYELSLDEFRGLYVSDEQVDRLVRGAATELFAPPPGHPCATVSDLHYPWGELALRVALEPLDLDLILLALAPEIDLKYETIYAYLNNDVTRKWPTLDLAQRLLGDDLPTRAAIAAALSPTGRLTGLGIVERIDPPSARPSLLNAGFALTPMVTQFLLGLPLADPRLPGLVEIVSPAVATDAPHGALARRLAVLQRSAGENAATIVLLGERGSGRARCASAICHELGMPMLRLELGAIRHGSESVSQIASALALLRRLQPAALYLEGLHTLCGTGEPPARDDRWLVQAVLCQPAPIFAACEPHGSWRELLRSRRMLVLRLDEADYSRRLAIWERQLGDAGIQLPPAERRQLADRLPLSPGQIEDTIATAADLATLADSAKVDAAALVAAARQQTDNEVGNLALKIVSRHGWDDIVLPAATRARVKELASAIGNRHVVYHDWGFARRVAAGTGLKAMFTGASGTGKTMTAGVIARELGFDLYKIELSGVVSKYIGETEKNLDRIFGAVRAANAMLFIDEAEAMLGKRSEVKDAHDRYANIEVAYLLQKLEEHDGVVILASNLKRNIDDAFARRMHYVIEFPLPDELHRKKLWRGMFPPEVPLGDDVDFDFLAKQFDLAGGDIRNVALDAAFLAAQDGRCITMKQLVRALARQLAKQGKIPSAAQFRQFHGLLS
jgi:ATPase family associated with various cellular activities (AAA)/Winged helix domain, variant